MKNKYLILFFGILIFSINTYAQLRIEKKEVNGNVSYSNIKYTYRAHVDFKVDVQGALEQDEIIVYRNVEGYEINSYTYKGVDASEVGYTYPITINRYKKKVFVDIEFYRGAITYTARNLEPDGSYYLRDSQKKSLYKTFNIDPKKKDCVTCPVIQEVKKLNVKALNIKLSDLTYLDIFSEINNKIEKKLRREKEEKRLKEKETKEISSIKKEKKLQNSDEDEVEKSNIEDNSEESFEEKEAQEKIERERQKEEERQRKLEEKKRRKEEAEQKRKEKISKYNKRIEQEQKENKAIAASAAASSAGILYLLGGIIYNKMGLPGKDLYTGSNFHFNFDIGYGVSVFPISYASEKTGVNYYTGDETTTKENTDNTAITIDLRLALKLGYETEYGGGNIYGRFEPGFSPIFTDFNTSYGYGLEIFGGHKNIKLYTRYERGANSFTSSNWIDPEQIGEGGNSSTSYQQLRAGLKFSFYRNTITAKRDHIILGVTENYFNEDSATVFSFRKTPDESLLNIIESTPKYTATGYFLEWKRDHTHRLYLQIFPNYPVTGEIGGKSNEGQYFVQIGFTRSIESFF